MKIPVKGFDSLIMSPFDRFRSFDDPDNINHLDRRKVPKPNEDPRHENGVTPMMHIVESNVLLI